MEDLFINEKPVRTLIAIRKDRDEVYCNKISKKVDTTYAHTVRIISRLEEKGLIKTNKKGRKKIIELTEKGEKYAKTFQELQELFNDEDEESSIEPGNIIK